MANEKDKNKQSQAQSQTERAKETAKDAAKSTASEAQDRAREVKGKVKEQAQEARGKVEAQAQENFEKGKGQVVSQISSVAQAFRKTSEQLREEDQGDLAGYTERIADQVDKVSGYLEDKGLRGLTRDLEGMARQRPGLFIGGALVLGLVAVRFLRSSDTDERYSS